MRNRTGGAPLPARNLPPHWRHGHDSAAEAEAKHWAKWANSNDADIVLTCCCLTLAAEAEAKRWAKWAPFYSAQRCCSGATRGCSRGILLHDPAAEAEAKRWAKRAPIYMAHDESDTRNDVRLR